jgi:Na+-translocating ferredoxin:NAD+ oxidoreductase subunit G
MAKLESTLKNMILSLTLISMGMSGALGFVYLKTKDPIAASDRLKKEAAVRQVIPPFDSVSTLRVGLGEGDTLTVNRGFKSGQLTGTAIETFSKKGFSGKVQFVVGILPDGTINAFGGFNHKETPGLGTKMKEPKFNQQFIGKNPSGFKLKVKKDGGDVDAISAATISSRAFCDGVQKAFLVLQKENEK